MNRITGVAELQPQFRHAHEESANSRIPYVRTRGSRPEAALVPYDDYLRFRQVQETVSETRLALLVAKMGKRNAQFTDEEIEADLSSDGLCAITPIHTPYFPASRNIVA